MLHLFKQSLNCSIEANNFFKLFKTVLRLAANNFSDTSINVLWDTSNLGSTFSNFNTIESISGRGK